jgi:hypothetical protein
VHRDQRRKGGERVISTPLGELLIGIHYVDYAAQKLSASFYRAVIAANGVV